VGEGEGLERDVESGGAKALGGKAMSVEERLRSREAGPYRLREMSDDAHEAARVLEVLDDGVFHGVSPQETRR